MARKGRTKHTDVVQDKYRDTMGYRSFHLTTQQTICKEVIESNTLSFVEGPAGSGKSAAILYSLCREYLTDPSKNLIVIRTPVEVGSDSVGFLPSDLSDKIAPHFASSKRLIEQMLTKGKVECDLDKRIHFLIPNFCLGSTFDNSLILIDEAQMLHPRTLKLLLERIGNNSRVVVAGDRTQLYSSDKTRNGLSDAIERFFDKDNMQPNYKDVGYCKFDVRDIVRSDICRTVVEAYKGLL